MVTYQLKYSVVNIIEKLYITYKNENSAPYPTCIYYSPTNPNDVVCLGNASRFFKNIEFNPIFRVPRPLPLFDRGMLETEFNVSYLSMDSFEVAYDIGFVVSRNFKDFIHVMHDMLLLPEQFSSFYCHLPDNYPIRNPVIQNPKLRYRACELMRYWQAENHRTSYENFVDDFLQILKVVDNHHLYYFTYNIRYDLKYCLSCTTDADILEQMLYMSAMEDNPNPAARVPLSEVMEKDEFFDRQKLGMVLYTSFYDRNASDHFGRKKLN